MGDGIGDILAGPGTGGGRRADYALEARNGFPEGNDAGGDGVDGDTGAEAFGKGLGEHDDAGFGCAVVGVIGPGAEAAEGADVNDTTVALGFHAATGFAAAKESRLEIDVVNEVPVGFGDLEGIDTGEAGGVVYEAVEASEVAVDGGKQGLDFGHLFQIGAKDGGSAALLRRGLGFGDGGVAVQGDAGTFAGEAESDGATDTPGGAGDQNDFSVEMQQQVLREVRRIPLA